jgi:hypothetical protein
VIIVMVAVWPAGLAGFAERFLAGKPAPKESSRAADTVD